MALIGTELPHPNGVGTHWAPHCDNAVLHAPGECVYCDAYPAWQRYRQVARIAFTGHEPIENETMCPSEVRRPVEVIQQWNGNRAWKEQR